MRIVASVPPGHRLGSLVAVHSNLDYRLDTAGEVPDCPHLQSYSERPADLLYLGGICRCDKPPPRICAWRAESPG